MDGIFTISLTILLCLGYAHTDMFTACRDGWLAYEGNCYLFGSKPFNFVEAEHYCRQHGGHLVEVGTADENNFLKSQLEQLKHVCSWIGMTDELIEGDWQWYTSKMRANYTDWHRGEPDGLDCSVFYLRYKYSWGDVLCSHLCNPVCKLSGFLGAVGEIVGK